MKEKQEMQTAKTNQMSYFRGKQLTWNTNHKLETIRDEYDQKQPREVTSMHVGGEMKI